MNTSRWWWCLAVAKVGGIDANATYSADFLLENLKIQTWLPDTSQV
jgi:hypothetical protein